jgi:hypothetical protein
MKESFISGKSFRRISEWKGVVAKGGLDYVAAFTSSTEANVKPPNTIFIASLSESISIA